MTGKNPIHQDNRAIKKRLIDRELSEVSGGFVPIEIDSKVPLSGDKPLPSAPKPSISGPSVTPRPGDSSGKK